MKQLTIFLFCILTFFSYFEGFSQKIPDDPNRKFGIVLNRGFMLNTEQVDSIPLSSGRSGSYFLGISYNLQLHKRFGFRIQPGFGWQKLYYTAEEGKTYPTTQTANLTYEKQRFTYVEMPVGAYFNINFKENNKPKWWVEAGGYFGYLISGVYKKREKFENPDQTQTTKISGVQNIEPLRYGVYGKVGYRWVALYYGMRLSDVFEATDGAGNELPSIPQMELGLSFKL